ncbi:MAG: site-specific integrase [Hyphomicrobiales bacterium]
MKARLTDLLISKSQAGPGERLEIFDTQVPGFGVRIGSRERAFFFIRRVNGQKTRMSIGLYPAVSLARARSLALSALDRIKAGEDPVADLRRRKIKSAESQDHRFCVVAERFIAQYCRGKKTPLRARTTAEYERHLIKGPASSWNDRTIESISEKDIIAIIDMFEGRSQFATARLFKSNLRKFFGWCVERHLIARNPAISPPLSSKPSDFVRERVLSIQELRFILRAADGLELPYRAFVYILALCGQRRHETSVMRWEDIDLDGEKPLWRLAASVTKNRRSHDVPLSPEAVRTLKDLPNMSDEVGAKWTAVTDLRGYVFSRDGHTPISGFSKVKGRVDTILENQRRARNKDESPMPHWTWHDLRRSAATGMANLGVPPHVIEAVLNHVSGTKSGVAGVYNRSSYDQERRQALALWADHLIAAGD